MKNGGPSLQMIEDFSLLINTYYVYKVSLAGEKWGSWPPDDPRGGRPGWSWRAAIGEQSWV